MADSGNARNFHHPFIPYDIQIEFMNAVYDCIEDRKVGILESPTGTGKSLSLLCASLTWLREHKRKQFEESISEEVQYNEPDWVINHLRSQRRKEALQRRSDFNARLAHIRAQEEKVKRRAENGEPRAKRITQKIKKEEEDDDVNGDVTTDEARFLVDDYESDDEHKAVNPAQPGISAQTQALIDQFGESMKADQHCRNHDSDNATRIFFCSRTHTQLTQMVSELKRVKMPPGLPLDSENISIKKEKPDESEEVTEDFKHISLGARKHLCINPAVNTLSNSIAMNEKCGELLQSGGGCDYLPEGKRKEAEFYDFRDRALAKIRDIEDIGNLGRDMAVCPYYATREAIDSTEIVSMPYPLLLSKQARQSFNIDLKDQIIIIDEAHNLIESITDQHSVKISLAQLKRARHQLSFYLARFRNKFRGKNRVYLAQLLRIVDSMRKLLEEKKTTADETEGDVSSGDIMSGGGADQTNVHKLLGYISEKKLAFKLDGYEQYIDQVNGKEQPPQSTQQRRRSSKTPCFSFVQNFMSALIYPSEEGHFYYSMPEIRGSKDDDVLLKYQHLDAVNVFNDVVQDARTVILAGGTMSPMDEYFQQVFPYLSSRSIKTLSCGHVIPRANLLAMSISKGSLGTDLKFTYELRTTPSMIKDLGLTIIEAAKVIPDGLVIFFPSYAYLETIIKFWRREDSGGQHVCIWDQLTAAKPIVSESGSLLSSSLQPPTPLRDERHSWSPSVTSSQSKKSKAEEALKSYADLIHDPDNTRGAMLFAVVSGSLSEGINFADKLGRGVIVVGQPFANKHSPEWKAKLEHIVKRAASVEERRLIESEAITNACMKSVNQAVGRVIRHQNDYASIMLLDCRYQRENMRNKLPRWIRNSFVLGRGEAFDTSLLRLRSFFNDRSQS